MACTVCEIKVFEQILHPKLGVLLCVTCKRKVDSAQESLGWSSTATEQRCCWCTAPGKFTQCANTDCSLRFCKTCIRRVFGLAGLLSLKGASSSWTCVACHPLSILSTIPEAALPTSPLPEATTALPTSPLPEATTAPKKRKLDHDDADAATTASQRPALVLRVAPEKRKADHDNADVATTTPSDSAGVESGVGEGAAYVKPRKRRSREGWARKRQIYRARRKSNKQQRQADKALAAAQIVAEQLSYDTLPPTVVSDGHHDESATRTNHHDAPPTSTSHHDASPHTPASKHDAWPRTVVTSTSQHNASAAAAASTAADADMYTDSSRDSTYSSSLSRGRMPCARASASLAQGENAGGSEDAAAASRLAPRASRSPSRHYSAQRTPSYASAPLNTPQHATTTAAAADAEGHSHPHLHTATADCEGRRPHLHTATADDEGRHPHIHTATADCEGPRPHTAAADDEARQHHAADEAHHDLTQDRSPPPVTGSVSHRQQEDLTHSPSPPPLVSPSVSHREDLTPGHPPPAATASVSQRNQEAVTQARSRPPAVGHSASHREDVTQDDEADDDSVAAVSAQPAAAEQEEPSSPREAARMRSATASSSTTTTAAEAAAATPTAPTAPAVEGARGPSSAASTTTAMPTRFTGATAAATTGAAAPKDAAPVAPRVEIPATVSPPTAASRPLTPPDNEKRSDQVSAFDSVLYPHQRDGVAFLWRQCHVKPTPQVPKVGCVLAHGRGLGKGLQVIAFVEAFLARVGKTALIAVPMGLMEKWKKEFAKWSREASASWRRYGNVIAVDSNSEHHSLSIVNWKLEGGVVLISHDSLQAFQSSQSRPIECDLLVLDARLGTSSALFDRRRQKLRHCPLSVITSRRVVITHDELIPNFHRIKNMVHFVSESHDDFMKNVIIPQGFQLDSPPAELQMLGKMTARLLPQISKVVHYRDCSCLAGLIPDLREFVVSVKLSSVQRSMNETFRRVFRGVSLEKCYTEAILLLAHPKVLLRSEIDPSHFSSVPRWGRDALPGNEMIGSSGKISIALGIMRAVRLAKQKVVVVSQSALVLDELENAMRLPDEDDHAVTCFWEKGRHYERPLVLSDASSLPPHLCALLVNTKTASEIVLLDVAHIILMDVNINHSLDRGAVSSCFRVGQRSPVSVYRLVGEDSIEERVLSKQLVRQHLCSQSTSSPSAFNWAFHARTNLEIHEACPTALLSTPLYPSATVVKEAPENTPVLANMLSSCTAWVSALYKRHTDPPTGSRPHTPPDVRNSEFVTPIPKAESEEEDWSQGPQEILAQLCALKSKCGSIASLPREQSRFRRWLSHVLGRLSGPECVVLDKIFLQVLVSKALASAGHTQPMQYSVPITPALSAFLQQSATPQHVVSAWNSVVHSLPSAQSVAPNAP